MPRLSKIGAAALAAFGWTGLQTVNASYLIVAGGGGGAGGTAGGGGGGAGGYQTGTTTLSTNQSYTVIVGAGGTGGPINTIGAQGSNSQFGTLTASVGGGYGGYQNVAASSGGSGGGAGGRSTTNLTGGSGTAGQGNAGGNALNDAGNQSGAGGGGAGAAGSNATGVSTGGAGGNGTASSISGSSVTYAGGGGGAGFYNTAYGTTSNGGLGGTGGGGTANSPGTANLGGGGGGGGGSAGGGGAGAGGNGGSGVVIISYVGSQQFGGGIVTSSGGNTIHTFNTSGTLSPLSSLTANFLVVAGGGGGGAYDGGGGGAGGLRSSVTNTGGGGSLESSLIIDTNSTYLVTVGAGGSGQISSTQSVAGSNSSFLSITSVGGGRGGGYTGSFYNASSGGSGGGSAYAASTAGSGTANQGYAGGQYVSSGDPGASGGGGAGAVGSPGTVNGGNGGVGVAVAISGTSTFYAGGGGGAAYAAGGSSSAGTGGNGGGGNGGLSAAGTAGTANRGGGGGGSQDTNNPPTNPGGNGGSGIVIISYAGSTPQMAGGTVTVAGGNVIHTFTSSGYLSPIVNLNNSLRFRSSASAWLNRTPASSSNLQTWTISWWTKRGQLSTAAQTTMFGTDYASSQEFMLQFTANNRFVFEQYASGGVTNLGNLITTQVFRDPSAWYHFVVTWDSTQATASNRIKIYVNGVQITAFDTATYPAQNASSVWNQATNQHRIGQYSTAKYYDGYMAEINFIDGQALTPSSFGAFNGQGVWQPVRYGGSYGTNGFYLPFNAGTSSFSGSFNGSNQNLSIASNSVFNQSGDFTIEYYANLTSNTNYQIVVGRGTGFITIQHSSDTNGMIRLVRYGQATLATGGNVTAGKWNHFAIVRSGSTVSGYLNGVLVATATDSTSTATGNALAIGQNGDNTNYFNGQISNVRYTNTAVYTSNFTPPTSALTAVTGTQLLTLQNSSIVDNSTNALSITNNNGVSTGQTYPFAINIFNDQGPAGNNWTPNNISGAFGSTLDYMTDVPTNTSATVANYCVLNPLDANTATLSDGNLNFVTASTTSVPNTSATIAVSSGKWYWEIIGTSNGDQGFYGIKNAAIGGYTSQNISYYGANGAFYVNNSVVATYATFTNNDVIGFALDADAKTIRVYKNNVAQGSSATSYSSFSSDLITAWVADGASGSSTTGSINFGQQPFVYTPPSGFVGINTFNLPTPTIGATPATTANKYMNIVLYTGDGVQDKTISGVGFQPDFVWIKNRGAAGSNVLYNAVTGGTKQLFSNLTDAEQTNNDITNGFSSDGFIVGDNVTGTGSTNQNTNTYVAWNWNAGGSTVTNTSGSITSQVRANTTAGFSVVTYTGNGTTSTVGHGLSVAPSMIIVKRRDAGSSGWSVYFTTLAAGNVLSLQSTNAASSSPNRFTTTLPTSTVFSIGTDSDLNASGGTYVAYCFAQVAGYSAFGSYTGNGSSDGPFVFTGFRPKFILIRRSDAAGGWKIYNTSGLNYNPINTSIEANDSGAEATSTNFNSDWLSNGFKLRTTYADFNTSGGTYIYMAFAESPFKYANAR